MNMTTRVITTKFAPGWTSCLVLACLLWPLTAFAQETKPAGKTLIDYFLPMPIHGALDDKAWGAPNVLPRDPKNGLEDTTIKQWCYWDGQIIKAPDGKYHMFASRWDQARGHGGWGSSLAIHSVSDDVVGPYTSTRASAGPTTRSGKGHNVTATVLPDGRYAVIVSETRPGDVFVSKSLDGPWEHLGKLSVEDQPNMRMSNVSVMARPDGDFEIVPRSGAIWISKNGASSAPTKSRERASTQVSPTSPAVTSKTLSCGSAAASTISSSTAGASARPST